MSDVELKTPTTDQDTVNLQNVENVKSDNDTVQDVTALNNREQEQGVDQGRIVNEDQNEVGEVEDAVQSTGNTSVVLKNQDKMESDVMLAPCGQNSNDFRQKEDIGSGLAAGNEAEIQVEMETGPETKPEPADQANPEHGKVVPRRTTRLCRDATFVTPPRANNPPRLSALEIDNQNAAISALISQQHGDLLEQNQRTKEIIAAVRRNIRNSIQTKRQEQLVRQNKHLPAARQNVKLASVNLNDFSCDLPKQRPRILLPSKRRAKRWRIKLPPLDKYHGNHSKYHGHVKKSGSMDFR